MLFLTKAASFACRHSTAIISVIGYVPEDFVWRRSVGKSYERTTLLNVTIFPFPTHVSRRSWIFFRLYLPIIIMAIQYAGFAQWRRHSSAAPSKFHLIRLISQRLVKAINIILKSHSATFCLEATLFCFFFVNNTTGGLYVVPTISPVEGIRLTCANTS